MHFISCTNKRNDGRFGHQLKDQISAIYLARRFNLHFIFERTEVLSGIDLSQFESSNRTADELQLQEEVIIDLPVWEGSPLETYAKIFKNPLSRPTHFRLTSGTRIDFSKLLADGVSLLANIFDECRELFIKRFPVTTCHTVIHVRRGDISPRFPRQLRVNLFRKKYANHDFINVFTYSRIYKQIRKLYPNQTIAVSTEPDRSTDIRLLTFFSTKIRLSLNSSVEEDFTKFLKCEVLVCSNSSLSNLAAFMRNKVSFGFFHEQFRFKSSCVKSTAS